MKKLIANCDLSRCTLQSVMVLFVVSRLLLIVVLITCGNPFRMFSMTRLHKDNRFHNRFCTSLNKYRKKAGRSKYSHIDHKNKETARSVQRKITYALQSKRQFEKLSPERKKLVKAKMETRRRRAENSKPNPIYIPSPIMDDEKPFLTNRVISYAGGIYEGQVRTDSWRPHGRGIMKYYNYMGIVISTYVGDFVNGNRQGHGEYAHTYKNDFYTGAYYCDHREGYGIRETDDGTYKGEFIFGGKSGKGVYYSSNGSVYEGQWRDDTRTGQGVMNYYDGGRYFGSFYLDQRNGSGTMTFANGDVYMGEFVKNEIKGQGVMTFKSNGTQAIGTFAKGYLEGKGKILWPNGDMYVGTVRNGTAEGRGVMTFANGTAEKRGKFVEGELFYDRKRRLYVPVVKRTGAKPLKETVMRNYLQDEWHDKD